MIAAQPRARGSSTIPAARRNTCRSNTPRGWARPASNLPSAVSAIATTNALAETTNGLFKAKVIHRCGPWRNFEAVEYATLEWVNWINNRCLLEPVRNIPPVEADANFYAALETEDMVPICLRQTRRGSFSIVAKFAPLQFWVAIAVYFALGMLPLLETGIQWISATMPAFAPLVADALPGTPG